MTVAPLARDDGESSSSPASANSRRFQTELLEQLEFDCGGSSAGTEEGGRCVEGSAALRAALRGDIRRTVDDLFGVYFDFVEEKGGQARTMEKCFVAVAVAVAVVAVVVVVVVVLVVVLVVVVVIVIDVVVVVVIVAVQAAVAAVVVAIFCG